MGFRFRRSFADACLALLPGLAGAAAWANQAGPAGDPQYFVEGLACQGGKFSLKLPATLPALLALGPRPRVERLETQRWEGYTTTHERVLFDGLYVDLIAYSNDPGRYSRAKVTIRSSSWARLVPFAFRPPSHAVRGKLRSAPTC